MYTTTTATREHVLKAVAATERAMERHTCSKSQFKFKCFSCGEMINRGDKITRCVKADAGMTLRYRGAGGECGLTMAETAFYQAELVRTCGSTSAVIHATGTKVSITATSLLLRLYAGCQRNGDVRSIVSSLNGPTGPVAADGSLWASPYFLMVKGYPKEKFDERPHRPRGHAISGSLARIHLQKGLSNCPPRCDSNTDFNGAGPQR